MPPPWTYGLRLAGSLVCSSIPASHCSGGIWRALSVVRSWAPPKYIDERERDVHQGQKQISDIAERDIKQAHDYHGRDQGIEENLTLRLSARLSRSAELQVHTGGCGDKRADQ